MGNKTVRIGLLVLFVVVFVSCAFGGGLVLGRSFPKTLIPATSQASTETPVGTSESTPADLQTLFAPFWDAWNLVHDQYVDQPVNDAALMEGAISGMMNSLGDPYTGYWTAQETSDVQITMSGEYDGIGAWVSTDGDYLTIIKPMAGYPAEKAGLQPGDKIIAVDGTDVTGMDPALVRQLHVLGQAGTDVTLTILREGVDEPFDVNVTRAHIVVPSVTSKMLDNNIGYVQLTQFGDSSAREVHNALQSLMDQNAQGIIFDLRDNTGGYTDQALAIASEFIDSGVIWYEEFNDGSRQSYQSLGNGIATEIPLVVLVNNWSASASEIVAGALQDHGRAKLVGVTTFGKGVVQTWAPMSNGGTARVTIARWLTPNGRIIHGEGFTPDVVVEMTKEDYDAARDPQLDAAVQVMLQELSGSSIH